MWRLVEYGRKNPDDKLFKLIEHAAPVGCALDDVAAWKIGNPALGDFLHEDALHATLMTTREAPFRRYRLGQWVGQEESRSEERRVGKKGRVRMSMVEGEK